MRQTFKSKRRDTVINTDMYEFTVMLTEKVTATDIMNTVTETGTVIYTHTVTNKVTDRDIVTVTDTVTVTDAFTVTVTTRHGNGHGMVETRKICNIGIITVLS